MKTSKLKLFALAAVMVVGIRSAQSGDMYFGFDTPYQLLLPGSSNDNGRVWLGNFGATSFNDVGSSVSGGVGLTTSLLSTFRPLTSFGVESGYFSGTGIGSGVVTPVYDSNTYVLSGKVNVGADVSGSLLYTAGQFAGQNAYLLVLNSYSDVWETAKTEWAASGSLTSILIKSGSDFDASTGDSSASGLPGQKFFSVSPGSGTLMLGYFNADSTMTASSVPEPSVGALLLLGGGALALIRARRNRE